MHGLRPAFTLLEMQLKTPMMGLTPTSRLLLLAARPLAKHLAANRLVVDPLVHTAELRLSLRLAHEDDFIDSMDIISRFDSKYNGVPDHSVACVAFLTNYQKCGNRKKNLEGK